MELIALLATQNKSIILYILAFITIGAYIDISRTHMLFLDP
jgi:hypothetical protein